MLDLNRIKDFKVLMVGDAIMDEYIYVRTIGKAVKESALSCSFVKKESFFGGVWAAANHVRNFCAQVDVRCGPQTMWNSRIVEEVYLRKLIVTHELKDNLERQDPFDARLYDLVIVCDFGHGTMTKELIAKLSKEARYLAVNTQTNATNYGFNLITKYPRTDFVVLDELEARLAARDRDSPIEDVILELGCKNIIVTRGANGAIGFDGAFERQKAVAENVRDTMGAGDAFLAIASPFAAAGCSMKELIQIGNAAGAAKVGIIGHRASVDKEALRRYLD